MDTARAGEPVTLIGVYLHVLAGGARYNTVTREASLG